MLRFILTGGPYGDATSSYDVRFPEGLTVGDLLDYILTNKSNERGYISNGSIFDRVLEYRYGNVVNYLSEDFEVKYKDAIIVELKASGGWSAMDYIFKLKEV